MTLTALMGQWRMARAEIHKRFGIVHALWWRFVPGETITVTWPTGWAVLNDDTQGGTTQVLSSDPNDHFRPWLEKNVGKQGWDWNWRISQVGDGTSNMGCLDIKFRKSKAKWASLFLLKWG